MIAMAACTYFTDWLRADVGGGVLRLNTYLDDVPLLPLPGHGRPPDLALITDPFRPGDVASDRCARWEAPTKYPALYVNLDGPVDAEGEVATIFRDGRVCLCARYLVRQADAAKSSVAAAYTMKALERATRDWLAETAEARAARGDDGPAALYVIGAEPEHGMHFGPWRERVGDAEAVQLFSLDLSVRDSAP